MALLLTAPLAWAQTTYTWTQATGGARNWDDGVNWSNGVAPSTVSGDTVDFSTVNIAANTTLTLQADRTAEIWKFGDTSNGQDWIVATGNKIILAGTTPTINVVNRTATLNNVLDGTSVLTKSGAGTLALTGSNTYTGGTVLNTGGLIFTSDSNLGATTGALTLNTNLTTSGAINLYAARAIVINNGAIWEHNNANVNLNINGPVSGTGGFNAKRTNAGSVQINLNSTGNTFTGPISMTGNDTMFQFNSLVDSNVGNITFSTTTTTYSFFRYGSGASASLALNNRQIVLATGNTIALIDNSSTNTFTIGSNLIDQGTGTKTLQLQGSTAGLSTFAGNIAQAGSTIGLTKAGSGTWVLSGTNTYSGGTTLGAGTLKANGSGALGSNTVTVSAGTLVIDAADAMADTASLYLPSAAAKNITMNANDTVGKLFLGGVQQPNGTYSSSGAGSAWMNTGSGVLTVGPASVQPVYWDLDGTTAGAGSATPAGTWNAANPFWNAVADGSGSVGTWTAGRTATFAAGTDATGTYTVAVDGTKDIGGLNFEEGTVTLSGGTALRLVSDSLAFVATNLTATIATPLTQDATARQLTKSGSGTLILAADNAYTSNTVVGAGILSVPSLANAGANSPLGAYPTAGAGGLSLNGGTFRYTGGSASSDRGLTLAGGSTIDVNPAATALTLGACSLGAFTLNVTGGTGSSLALGDVTLTGAATLNPTTANLTVASFTGVQNLTLSGTSSSNVVTGVIGTGAGTLTKSGTGTWTLAGTNTYTGATSVSGGTLLLDGGAITNSSNVKLTGNSASLILTNGASVVTTADLQTLGYGVNSCVMAVVGSTGTSKYNGKGGDFGIGYTYSSAAQYNRLVIGAGGVVTNVGNVWVGSGGAYTSGSSYNNQLLVSDGGKLFANATLKAGVINPTGNDNCNTTNNTVLIANGSVVRAGAEVYVGALDPGRANGNGSYSFNSLTITNGGQLYSGGATSYIGRVVSTYAAAKANSNTVTVAGSLNGTNALWNLGGKPLIVGYTTTSTAIGNVLTVGAGGVVTNISTLTVSPTNTLSLGAGGRIYVTGALNVNNATLNIVTNGAPIGTYVLASYGTLTGSFAATNGIPRNNILDMNYKGLNQVAIVAPPSGMLLIIR